MRENTYLNVNYNLILGNLNKIVKMVTTNVTIDLSLWLFARITTEVNIFRMLIIYFMLELSYKYTINGHRKCVSKPDAEQYSHKVK